MQTERLFCFQITRTFWNLLLVVQLREKMVSAYIIMEDADFQWQEGFGAPPSLSQRLPENIQPPTGWRTQPFPQRLKVAKGLPTGL